MTLAQFEGFLAAVARDEKSRFINAVTAARIGGAEDKSYRKIMDQLEKD